MANVKKVICFFVMHIVCVLSFVCYAQAPKQNSKKKYTFDVQGVYYRYPAHSFADSRLKLLGEVTATIEMAPDGKFRLIMINGKLVKMDSPSDDLLKERQGYVRRCLLTNEYLYDAYFERNGVGYSVLFDSEIIEDLCVRK